MKRYPEIIMGASLTLLFLFLSFFQGGFFGRLEFGFHDLLVTLSAEKRVHESIVIVEIDNRSLAAVGRWPWSAHTLAKGLRKINLAAPKVIGLGVMPAVAEDHPEKREIAYLRELFEQTAPNPSSRRWSAFMDALGETEAALDGERVMAEAVKKTGGVILPVRPVPGDRLSPKAPPLPDGHTIPRVSLDTGPPLGGVLFPLPALTASAEGTGILQPLPDRDGRVRRERLLHRYGKGHLPSYALRLAAAFREVPPERITTGKGNGIGLGSRGVTVDSGGMLGIGFRKSPEGFLRCSWIDAINGKVPPSLFRNKLVLITPAAPGIAEFAATPVNPAMSIGELTAHAAAAILGDDHILRPGWEPFARAALILIAGSIATLLLPRLSPLLSLSVAPALFLLLAAASAAALAWGGIWLRFMLPALLPPAVCAGVLGIRYMAGDRLSPEREENLRMTGVMLQKRGMLDEAFETFRKIPVDEEMKELLYGLGRDYEKQLEVHKALYVYQYLEEHDPAFKDLARRKTQLLQAGETVILGEDGPTAPPETGEGATAPPPGPGETMDADAVPAEAADKQPKTLGRYEIVGELGRGAMGVVYKGRDPRINRVTAIKTIRFADSYESREAEKAKASFFREAESAGTLSHPHIVTIYDAGEEAELAYIAMEFLEGEDLTAHTPKDRLLPVRKVIDHAADIADALDFAHEKGIVHRDIKPANIMLLKNGGVKITDFGIARITASSQTRTGVVKGTPFYMSPEQITGKKVDGRTDIYSLGIMLYQLLTGEIPFSDDNPAALMHKILHDPPPDPRSKNPAIYNPLAAIIDKALEKEPGRRYQRAGQMATHLRKLARLIDDAAARKRARSREEGR